MSYTIPVDVHAVGLSPHMHLLGQEMKVTATLPDGKKQPLIWITDWDFNWQGRYQFAKPIALPKGTRVEMEAFFDNSRQNPKNPNDPPRIVRQGGQTTDEMCECSLQIVLDHPARDDGKLQADLRRARMERRRAYRAWLQSRRFD